jgi:16S rRNA (cytidine1402-2'-O)-methyltransferase
MIRVKIAKDDTVKTLPRQLPPPAGLYIIATPIGNLKDITLRALDLLEAVDLIACEDTRVSAKLLSHYGIRKPTLSYNDHNGAQRRPQILAALAQGKRVALLSDAGTPLVSDPGYKLVCEAMALGHHVTTLPGTSSVLAALCLSGLPSDRFLFAGFLPAKKDARTSAIAELAPVPATLIFFESARRLSATLSALQQGLGNRRAAVVREITKLYEESKRATLAELIAHYEREGEPKGEVVIVVSPPEQKTGAIDDVQSQLALLLRSHSVKEAAAILAEQTGLPRKEIYALALTLKESDDDSET